MSLSMHASPTASQKAEMEALGFKQDEELTTSFHVAWTGYGLKIELPEQRTLTKHSAMLLVVERAQEAARQEVITPIKRALRIH